MKRTKMHQRLLTVLSSLGFVLIVAEVTALLGLQSWFVPYESGQAFGHAMGQVMFTCVVAVVLAVMLGSRRR